jgi:predicted DNA-binding transcriptional regulator YafY
MAAQYTETPLAETLGTLFEKLRALLPDKITVDPVFFRSRISFYGHYAKPISQEIWLEIFRALRESRVIQFRYRVPYERTGHVREVEPVHMACLADEWYLIGYDRRAKDVRHFAVARVQSVLKDEGEQFELREFDADEYFANRFGRFVGQAGEFYQVVIKFDPDTAIWIPEREWHPKQKIRKHRDGSLTLSFPAPSLYEVKRWVLQWGAGAEVIQPEELKEEIKNELKGMKAKYVE